MPPTPATPLLQRPGRVLRWLRDAILLVDRTDRTLLGVLGSLTIGAGLLPVMVATTGRRIVDAVVAASAGEAAARHEAFAWIAAELALVSLMAAAQRGLDVAESLLRVKLGHEVNVAILRKALELDLVQFEDSELYDRLTRARREASSRPLSLVRKTFGLAQNGLSLASYAVVLVAFSPWSVALLAIAALPAFVAETRFAGEAFRLFSWRAPETREQMYLETVVARDDHAKEVKLLGVGPMMVDRYIDIFHRLYAEDRKLTLKRGAWGTVLGWLSTLALYAAYAWIATTTMSGGLTLGAMTMVLLVFKQGQAAFSAVLRAVGGMYEDHLYLENLREFLELPVPTRGGTRTTGAVPGDGLRFEDVSFTYPGSREPAVSGVSFHLRPGRRLALVGHNGSGKTTLVKLLTGLYEPATGRVLLDGTDLREWEPEALRQRIAVLFQDFVRYQLTVGENIGVGDVRHATDEVRWARAADRGMAAEFVDRLPDRYRTRLGRWFHQGQELSGGQWQKIALSRAFAREDADLLVLDEPTSAMDAEAEAQIFERVRSLQGDQMAILVSHRFSTVRMADHVVVLDAGRIVEEGSHEQLMALAGRYATLFALQAAGYR